MSLSMPFKKLVSFTLASGQPYLWLKTNEQAETLRTLQEIREAYPKWDLFAYSAADGLRKFYPESGGYAKIGDKPVTENVHSVVNLLQHFAQNQLDPEKADDIRRIVVLMNGQREFEHDNKQDKLLASKLLTLNDLFKGGRCHFVVLAPPSAKIYPELEDVFFQTTYERPDVHEREALITEWAGSSGVEATPEQFVHWATATGGLTRQQVESVCTFSLMKDNVVQDETIWELKSQIINSSGLVRLHRGNENFDSLGGLEGLKDFCQVALAPRDNRLVSARALLLLGVPGSGKSAFAKALGNQLGRATLFLDIGALMGGFVGDTERNTRDALRIADTMEPCLLFVDELEKALGSGGQDGGVGSRLRGAFLTWLNDHTSDVVFIGTANNIKKLTDEQPEFTRAERFDGIFFFDLPSRKQKDKIWDLYTAMYRLDPQSKPDDTGWTGAEIKACCKFCRLLETDKPLSLIKAAEQVIPISVTAAEQIKELKVWANNRCMDAETGEVYKANRKTEPEFTGKRLGRKFEKAENN